LFPGAIVIASLFCCQDKNIKVLSEVFLFTTKFPTMSINWNFKLDNCYYYKSGCFTSFAMTTQDWDIRRERDRCKIIIDCLSSELQFAAIPLSLHWKIEPCHCEERSDEATPKSARATVIARGYNKKINVFFVVRHF
jgi:hypothetical protein